MPYTISPYRIEFEARTNSLRSASYRASISRIFPSDLRDLVFQAAILQASAAIEDYVKSMFDDWAFKAKNSGGMSNLIPIRTRAAMVSDRLTEAVSHLMYSNDEVTFLKKVEKDVHLWELLEGSKPIPKGFDGSSVYNKRKYPSSKNLKVLFSRIGVDKIFDEVSKILKADAEMRLEAFNSIRTAMAHAQPPQLTYLDIRRNIRDVQSLVRAFDRVSFKALSKHLGQPAW